MTRQYFELNGSPSSILSFSRLNAATTATLREIIAELPIRPFAPDSSQVDRWEDRALVGQLDDVLQRLTSDIYRDQEDTARTLPPNVRSELLITESNLRPDALHVITRLRPTDREGESISYGARVQRVASDQYALWSDY